MTPSEQAVEAVRRRARPGAITAAGVDVHFHPDVLAATGRTVLEELIASGRWRTQFETGTSGGGLTAFPGGDRWRWESTLFDGAYDRAVAEDRPVYGALRPVGGEGRATRFGSAHLRLRAAVLERTTLCFPDSHAAPEAVGTPDAAGAIFDAVRVTPLEDPLDQYVEAHVHGGVRLDEDVEALVLDPSFLGTSIEAVARAARVPVEWHAGFALDPAVIPGLAPYRGDDAARAALEVAGDETLTPRVLGFARPGLDAGVARRVWHLLAAFGDRRPPLDPLALLR